MVRSLSIRTARDVIVLFLCCIQEYNRTQYYCGPGSKIPEWFRYQNVGASATFHLPILNSSTFKLLGFALSAVVVTKHKKCTIAARIRTRWEIPILRCRWIRPFDMEHVIILFYPLKFFFLTTDQLIQMSGTVSEVYFDMDNETTPAILECGVHPFYKEEVGSSEKINQGSTKKRKEEVGSSVKINQASTKKRKKY